MKPKLLAKNITLVALLLASLVTLGAADKPVVVGKPTDEGDRSNGHAPNYAVAAAGISVILDANGELLPK